MKSINFLQFILFALTLFFLEVTKLAACEIKESTASAGGYRELKIGRNKLTDVDSFKEIDGKVFYAISPVYGKPEIGVIDCVTDKRSQIVAPKNIDKSYPEGADFFRIKDITSDRKTGSYILRYYYAPDVDKQDFKKFENTKNLKSVNFSDSK